MSRAVTPGNTLSGLRSLGFPVRLRAGAQRNGSIPLGHSKSAELVLTLG
jgi:hypothetical protein